MKVVCAKDYKLAQDSVRAHCESLHLSTIRTAWCEDMAAELIRDGHSVSYAVGEAKQQAERYTRRPYQPSKQPALRAVQ